jgi:hypothetical protein
MDAACWGRSGQIVTWGETVVLRRGGTLAV